MKPFLRKVIGPTALLALGIAIGAAPARMPVRDPAALGTMKSRVPMRQGTGNALLNQLLFSSLTWYACALSAPLFIWLARRFPFSRHDWLRPALLHAVALAAMVLLSASAYFLVNVRGGDAAIPMLVFVRSRLVIDAIPFLALVAVIHAFEYRRRERAREAEAIRLSAQLTQSRLDALTAQLEPHFLFNTLQGISTLMHRDVASADAMLSQLSDLLRRSLSRGDGQHVIPLRDELAMLDDYIAICRQRYRERLDFRRHVAAGLDDALVPFFIVQPLVENAIKHGIAKQSGTGRIDVNVTADAASLQITVGDDGPGVPENARDGVGLANTRERLRTLYGNAQTLAIESPPKGGAMVSVTIPLRRAPAT